MKNLQELKALGMNLRRIRKEKGFSQITLADEVDVARSTIQRVENAEINATADLIISIAKALKVNPRELLDIKLSNTSQ